MNERQKQVNSEKLHQLAVKFPLEQLMKKAAHPTADLLDFNQQLIFLSEVDLSNIFSKISPRARILNLSCNYFGLRQHAKFSSAFKNIPSHIHTLDLSDNLLSDFTEDALIEFFSNIPCSITYLKLNKNFFSKIKAENLARAFSTLHALERIDLIGNSLGENLNYQLALSTLPKFIKVLDLNRNSFDKKTIEQVLEPFAFHPYLEYILINNQTCLHPTDFWIEKLLAQLKKSLHLLPFQSIKPSILIDDKRLNLLINALEKRNDPLAYLACALLLEGLIQNNMKNKPFLYTEKRTHNAIDFYLKSEFADETKEFKYLIEFILWQHKIVSEIPSIQKRFSEYDLSPPQHYAPNCYAILKSKPVKLNLAYDNSFFFFKKKESDSKNNSLNLPEASLGTPEM